MSVNFHRTTRHYFAEDSTLHYNIILSCKPTSPKWFLLYNFSEECIVCIFNISVCATYSAYLILLDLIILKFCGTTCILWNLFCNFLLPLRSNIPFFHIFYSNINLRISINVTKFHAHKINRYVTGSYILILTSLIGDEKTNNSEPNGSNLLRI
jgi:hypothetical protein